MSPSARNAAALVGALLCLGPAAPGASAAAPSIGDVWASAVQPTNARLNAEVNPGGKASSYRFDYLTKAAYEANVAGAKDPFTGASKLPASGTTSIPGTAPTTISPLLFGLSPDTPYRYRLVVSNIDGGSTGPTRDLRTFPTATPFELPEGRGWELVSPAEKNGGGVAPAAEAGGGTSRAAAQGSAAAFASPASFANGAGATPFSQYIATRTSSSWSTENVTPGHLTGAYESAPFVGFSSDLARSLYLNPAHCPAGDPCPAGYRLRESASGLLTPSPADPGSLIAASPDLKHTVFEAAGELFRWSPPAGLLDLNAAPAAVEEPAFVSSSAARLYYHGSDGNLHLREGAVTKQVDDTAGGGGSLEAASADGATALFTRSAHLHLYSAATDTSEDLVPSGGVVAGSARLSPDAAKALFATTVPLETEDGTTYDNKELGSGTPSAQLYLLDLASEELLCLSCNPTHARPLGPSSVPGPALPHAPRAMSADNSRVFFDSEDALVLSDVNLATDVYRWAALGTAGCSRPNGCLALISAGLAGSSSFFDASADGTDAFFLTDRSLVGSDPGFADLYDARVGGGFPEPAEPPLCLGDACQSVPASPEDPVLTTVLAGPGNSPEHYVNYRRQGKRCPPGKRLRSVKSKGGKRVKRCVKVKRGRGGRR